MEKKITGTRTNTLKSLLDPYFISSILFFPQFAFYPWSAVCSLHFTVSLHFTPGLQSAFYTDRFPFGIGRYLCIFSPSTILELLTYRTDLDNRSRISLVINKFVYYQGSSLAAASSLLKLPNDVTYFPLLHNGSAAFELSLHVVSIGIIDSIGRIFLPDRQTRNVLKITISHFGYFRLGNQSIFDRLYRRNKFHKVKCKTNFKNTYVLSELSNRRLVTQPRQHRSLNWSSN